MGYDKEFEAKLIKLGFKRRWLSDKSGYWMEKSLGSKDVKFRLNVETDHNLLVMEAKVGDGTYYKDRFKVTLKNWEIVGNYKLSISEVNRLIKKYGK